MYLDVFKKTAEYLLHAAKRGLALDYLIRYGRNHH